MYSVEKYPSRVLQEAVEAIASLPGVGARSALRLALNLLDRPSESIHRFASAIGRLADDVHYCSNCRMVADGEICPICADPDRNPRLICVVESIRDVMSIEATGQHRGVYHVLGGIISPIDGIGPSDIHIPELVERIGRMREKGQAREDVPASDDTEARDIEIILALSGDVEGETTSLYIYRQLEPLGVKVTTLARGLGFGDDLEYADALTLGRSLQGRIPFKP